MVETQARILIIEDDQAFLDLLRETLTRRGYQTDCVTRTADADQQMQRIDYDLILTDINIPGETGTDFCARLQQTLPDLPVLVMTAFGSLETAIEALRAGAYDFITKPVDLDLLGISLERALQHRRLTRQVRLLEEQVKKADATQELIGNSPALIKLREQISRLAPVNTSVMISGESGTGKELVARALHHQSGRKGRFIAINCAALPESLLESELFGHAKGAFTDAHLERRGLFVEADGGTLFLDEIAELPLALQPKLLRALEERRVRPLGGSIEIDCDVRILAASHRDLKEAVASGAFRDDLYYRLNVIELQLPPLADRGNDILLLASRFITELAPRFNKRVEGLSAPAAARLLSWKWPGNVRELRNVIERGLALCRHDQITLEDLPEPLQKQKGAPARPGAESQPTLAEVEARYLAQIMEETEGNRTLAAKILGIDRKTLYRKLNP
ncbi:sigma-54-dependent transcriptional regulator [Geopsychrobacter electrodiphilus]|uniref:sigma-54-dependent transcriptional regulator n=1 Tax=Geopsychrobacter electrodiphilus TaxID=225196 RepID=UPI00036FD780|nr:sigma-54 dependent transcriptional regulator [Geopsychrobacter electrodiphilus]